MPTHGGTESDRPSGAAKTGRRSSAELEADLRSVFAQVTKAFAAVGTKMLRLGLSMHGPVPVGDLEHPAPPYMRCRLDGKPWPCDPYVRLTEQLEAADRSAHERS